MISKGRNVSKVFPDVVKNVVCPNVQVKKLVYMYIIHYSEFEQETVLLSINTFQKDLDNPNPYIRAQSLRVLSSLRLKVISQVLLLAIKKCILDPSVFVRKTAAHAILKVYGLV
jgi:AP-3 complex subunit beta